MTSRHSISRKDRARLFSLYAGECYLCNGKIGPAEAWEIEHVIPWELTRDDSDDNLRLAHKKCHAAKTANDIRAIRKADRNRDKHNGTFKPSGRGFYRPPGTEYDWRAGRYVTQREKAKQT